MTTLGLGLRAEVISHDKDVQYGQFAVVYRMGNKQSRTPVELAEVPADAVLPEPLPLEEPMLASVQSACVEVRGMNEDIHFQTDSDELSADGIALIDQVRERLASCSDLTVELVGHTDSIGAEVYNQALSERRANAVKQKMYSMGAESFRITSKGYGETQPKSSNKTIDGRKQNRRVEFVLR